jgi:hypothetical protein
MIRRKTSLFFLVLANIVILAHVFIPHHHHGEHLCLGNTDCHTHSAACQHEEEGDGHHHDGKTTDDCCQLKQITALPANIGRQDWNTQKSDIPAFDGNCFLLPESISGLFGIVIRNAPSALPDNSLIKPSFLTHTHGLRAPPTA